VLQCVITACPNIAKVITTPQKKNGKPSHPMLIVTASKLGDPAKLADPETAKAF
jgi:hypothetical protein